MPLSSSMPGSVPGDTLLTKSSDTQGGSTDSPGSMRQLSSSFANDKSLKASFQKSDGVDAKYVLSYLEKNPEIQELSCEDVIGAEDLGPLHRLLVNYYSSMHLHSLGLPQNELASDAGDDISRILLSQQQTLSKLDLSGNPLMAAGCSALLQPLTTESSPSRLKILNLCKTQLGSKGATIVASILRYNASIQELYLGHNNMGTKGMRTLAPELAVNSTLQILDVSFNKIKKNGATILADTLYVSSDSRLRIVDITCNNLGPAGLQAFAKLLAVDRKLEGLYAGQNNLGPEGASILSNALKLNYTLRDLHVEANGIGDAGALVLADGLAENKHRTSAVEKLLLGWNEIGLEGCSSLAEILKENEKIQYIDLTGNKVCCGGAEALAESLSYNLSLRELILARNTIGDSGAFAFAMAMGKPTCNLQKLECRDNPISNVGQASLERVPQLRRNQKYWLGQVIRDIAKGAITSVHLAERNIGDEELLLLTEVLEKVNPLVRSIWLSGSNLSPRSLLPFFERSFGSASKVVRVYMKNCNCGDDVAQVLSGVLRLNRRLEVLSLSDSSVSAVGASALAEGLSGNRILRRLNLDRNRIGDVGMAALGQVISGSALQSLSVSGNNLTDQSMDFEAAKHLEELHMNGNQITDRGVLDLCRFLMDDCRLVWLSLRRNQVTNRGGEAIKTFLPATATADYQ